MRLLAGLDDTDSSRGWCTTYLAYRIATDLRPEVNVLPYPKLVRLNPNIPFKTRGNAAVCLEVEAQDADTAFASISGKVEELSDVEGGANSGMVLLQDPLMVHRLGSLYLEALTGVVNPARVRRLLRSLGAKSFELGNGMGIVGAAASIGFDERFDHTYELIAYRRRESWGRKRTIDGGSVREMDAKTFPHTFNNFDHQKHRVLLAPHGPDPVFAGVRGDSPQAVIRAFGMLEPTESLAGHMVYVSNQHTDAHLQKMLEWKVFSSGWLEGSVEEVTVGAGGHVYVALMVHGRRLMSAAYEPTGDLMRTARLLRPGDRIRAFGGVRRATPLHPMILNMEKFEVLSLGGARSTLRRGTYISSPRANRHLTKPLTRYGRENHEKSVAVTGWLESASTPPLVLARSPR